MRDLCNRCGKHPRAINYKKQDRTYYRKLCDACIISDRKNNKALWEKQGYRKKFRCESCDFVPKLQEQLTVCEHKGAWYTVCLNCDVYVKINNKMIRKSDLKSDF